MFQLPDLRYSYDQLEPYIDVQTMELHHSKHHQTYVDKLNAAIKGTAFENQSIESILQQLDQLPEDIKNAVRNNGGGHYNHSFFWEIMTPGAKSEPQGALLDKMKAQFGSFEGFKEVFEQAAVNRFGSGWAWLIADGDGLKVTSTPNQDSPISDGIVPILGLDVWEHAYYLKYQNRRPEYIKAWWEVVNWDVVSQKAFL